FLPRTRPHYHSVFNVIYLIQNAAHDFYTLSLHDALPILAPSINANAPHFSHRFPPHISDSFLSQINLNRSSPPPRPPQVPQLVRSEEHTSALQSRFDLVCRLLPDKKTTIGRATITTTE